MTNKVGPEVQAARDNLTAALLNLTQHDQRPPCAGDGRFISDDAATLAQAAAACQLCPIRRECAAAGEFEVAGVWAGAIRDQTYARRTSTTTDERAS